MENKIIIFICRSKIILFNNYEQSDLIKELHFYERR